MGGAHYISLSGEICLSPHKVRIFHYSAFTAFCSHPQTSTKSFVLSKDFPRNCAWCLATEWTCNAFA